MKLTQTLYKQHLGWYFKKFWAIKSQRKVVDTKLAETLTKQGISVFEPKDVLKTEWPKEKINIVGMKPIPQSFDQTHPNWHDENLLTYKDNNVLLEGLSQAKILTKTVEIKEGLPEKLLVSLTNKDIDKKAKEIILSSHIFDAEQKKLPRPIDPDRPAYKFRRMYGVSQERAVKLLLPNLIQLIESKSDYNLVKERMLVNDLLFSYNFKHLNEQIQFELKGDLVLTSSKPLSPMSMDFAKSFDLPDIFPVKATVTLNKENIYEIRNLYPINLEVTKSYPHTIFVHHIEDNVKNLYEEPVTEQQIFGRSLLKTFTVAASFAKRKFGNEIKKLPQPVTLQCVQSNGRLFHFGILQLNTLDVVQGTSKNIWYQTGMLPLFDSCSYEQGKPTLKGYNSEVVKYLSAFYNNV